MAARYDVFLRSDVHIDNSAIDFGAALRPIRVLALMEARWVTGPAKNLIAFTAEARRLRHSGLPPIELSVATFQRPAAPVDRFLAALESAGIPFHAIPERCMGDPRVVSRLRAIAEAERPDIVQTHNTKSHLMVKLAGLPERARWIAFHHGFTALNLKDRAYNCIGRCMLAQAPQIVTVCEAFREDLRGLGISRSRVAVRHNMVARFEPPGRDECLELRRRLGVDAGARVLLTVGRLSSEKGHADLIDAIRILNARRLGKPFRLLIVGDGAERGALEERARRLGVAELVIFAGQQESVRLFYGMADIFVLPSRSEGSPNVLLEAMAAGLPIATTAAGGAAELVSDGRTALVAPCRNAAALSDAIFRLLSGGQECARLRAAAQAASRSYSAEAYTRALVAIYQAAMIARPITD